MIIYICEDCRQGFDIECSGGIACPECGNKKWKQINKLPCFAEEYRKKWADEYGIMICNDEDDIAKRKVEHVTSGGEIDDSIPTPIFRSAISQEE
tara:strand:- start:12 stop:296 length:285 start_codon:yes stop_codon:yes gene_type:complete